MPRVLHICTSSDFLQFTAPLLRRMAGEGIEVHAVSSAGDELVRLGQATEVRVHPLAMARGVDPFADARALPHIIRLMRQLRPHIVHAHTPKAGLLGMMAASLTGIGERVYQMHGLRYESTHGAKRALLKNIERLSCSLAQHVICVSPSVENLANQEDIVPRSKSRVFGEGSIRGIDGVHFNPDAGVERGQKLRAQLGIVSSDFCIGFAGRLNRDKGLVELSQSLVQLAAGDSRVHLLLAGEMDVTDPVDLSILRAHERCHFLGQVEDLRPFYGACDTLTLPSYREGLPQVLLEAAAMELPVVASRVTGSIDVVSHEETGLLVIPRDSQALTLALRRLLDSEVLRRALGRRARRQVLKKFPPDLLYDELLEFYRNISAAFVSP